MSIFVIGNDDVIEYIYSSDSSIKWSVIVEYYKNLLEKINVKLTPLVDTFEKIRYYV